MSDPTKRRLLELDAKGKPTFKYTRHDQTDVAATFKRVMREQAKQKAAKVCPIKATRGKA